MNYLSENLNDSCLMKNKYKVIMKKILLSLIAVVVISFSVQAQIDTEFWLACPDLNGAHGESPILLHLATEAQPTTIYVEQPAMQWKSEAIDIPAYSSYTLNLTIRLQYLECVKSDAVENRGLYVSSTAPIMAYYEVADKLNSDLIAMKGKSALGTSFFVAGQNRLPGYAASRFSCDIVATEDATIVTITPTKDVAGHPASAGSFTVNLNRGQTYSMQLSTQGLPADRPLGSVVKSNKPIAITSKDCSLTPASSNPSVPGGYKSGDDVAMDQSIPIENIGQEYILTRGSLTTSSSVPAPDFFFVTATQDFTEISVAGKIVDTINTGETYQGLISTEFSAIYIYASKPVYLFHITGYGGEVGGAIVPSIICTGSVRIPFARSGKVGTIPGTDDSDKINGSGYTPKYFELTMFIRSGYENDLILTTNNGTPKNLVKDLKVVFTPVKGNPDWVAAKHSFSSSDIPSGSSNVLYQDKGEPFHMGIINGDENTCRYGFFSDFRKLDVGMIVDKPNQEYCEGDQIKFTATPYEGAYYTWIGPSNKIIQEGAFLNGKNTYYYQKPKITVADTGYYKVVTQSGGCQADTNRIHITIYKNPQFQFGKDTTVCIGTTLLLDPKVPDLKYNWSTGDTTESIYTNPNPGITEYSLLIRNQYPNITCIASDTIVVTVSDIPAVSFMPSPYPSEGCGEATISFKNYTDPINAKFHWDFGDGTQSAEVNPVHTYTAVSGALSDTYDVTLIASNSSNCADTIKIDKVITMYRKPNAEFIHQPEPVHASNPVAKFIPASEEVPGFQYYWNFGDESTDTTYAPSHIYEAITAEYTVFYKVTNPLSPSCADSTSQLVKVINDSLSYTNVLTPNGDGINDVFIIKNLIAPNGMENYPENTLYVYNRYGKRVFYDKDYKNNW